LIETPANNADRENNDRMIDFIKNSDSRLKICG